MRKQRNDQMKNSDYMYISIKSKLQTITDHLRKPVQVNVKEKKKNGVMVVMVLIPFSSCVTLHKLYNVSETSSSGCLDGGWYKNISCNKVSVELEWSLAYSRYANK